jgi:hypothetical protein
MVKKKQISEQEKKRENVALLLKSGIDKPSTAAQVGLTLRTVHNIAKRISQRKKMTRKPGSKGVKSLLKSHKNKIINILKRNPFLTCQNLRDDLHIPCSAENIRLYLVKTGFRRRKPRGILELTKFHKDQRLSWCQSMLEWNGYEHVVYSDECSMWLHDNNHEGWFHHELSHPLSIDNHAGKIHVWASISFLGKICLRTFRVNNNQEVYESILRDGLQSGADSKYGGPGTWIFSPIHTARSVKNYLQTAGILVLDWPSKSRDLNPIENLWSVLKKAVRRRLPKNINELKLYILDEWENISDYIARDLCNSMRFRVLECIQARGGLIEY